MTVTWDMLPSKIAKSESFDFKGYLHGAAYYGPKLEPFDPPIYVVKDRHTFVLVKVGDDLVFHVKQSPRQSIVDRKVVTEMHPSDKQLAKYRFLSRLLTVTHEAEQWTMIRLAGLGYVECMKRVVMGEWGPDFRPLPRP